MAGETTPTHRLNIADASPELREKLAQARARAIATRHLEGPPANVVGDTVRFYFTLRSAVVSMRKAREAAGLTAGEVATKCGVSEEDVTRLESGTFLNPSWKLLGDYAHAVGMQLTLGVEPTLTPP